MTPEKLQVKVCVDKNEWNNALQKLGANPLQMWDWGQFKARHNWEAQYLFVVTADGELVGSSLVLWRKLPGLFGYFAYLPRGPVVARDPHNYLLPAAEPGFAAVADAVAAWIRAQRRVMAITAEPDEQQQYGAGFSSKWRSSTQRILSAETMILDLTQSEAEIMQSFDRKARYDIRRALQVAGLEFRPVATEAEFEKCLRIYRETAVRANFGIHQDAYYRSAFKILSDDNSPVWAAFYEGEPVCFSFLIHSAWTSFELYGGMTDDAKPLRANYGLKWEIIREMKRRGVQRYDFGGMVEGGVGKFKKHWGSCETRLLGTWDYPGFGYWVWAGLLPIAKQIMRRVVR